jgi:hypothetical protein
MVAYRSLMKASGTTLSTSTRPAAWACGEIGAGSAFAEPAEFSARHAAPSATKVHLR